VTEIREEGFSTFEQVAAEVKLKVINEKKAELLVKQFNTAKENASSITEIANKVALNVTSASAISFNSNSLPLIGLDKGLIGAIVASDENSITDAIVGNNGVIICFIERVVKPSDQTDFSSVQFQELYKLNTRVEYDGVFNALRKSADITDKTTQRY
jgi:hypothetical protein